MKDIIFENTPHKINYLSFLRKIPKALQTPENLATIYLAAWIETVKPHVVDQIIDFQTCSINLYSSVTE